MLKTLRIHRTQRVWVQGLGQQRRDLRKSSANFVSVQAIVRRRMQGAVNDYAWQAQFNRKKKHGHIKASGMSCCWWTTCRNYDVC
jgi:hypothetical protein